MRKGQRNKPVKLPDEKPKEEGLLNTISGVHKPIIPQEFPSKLSQVPETESARPATCEIPKVVKQPTVDAENNLVKPMWKEREEKEANKEEMQPPKYVQEEEHEPPFSAPKDGATEIPQQDEDTCGRSEEVAGIPPLQIPGTPEMIEPSSGHKVQLQYQGEQPEDTSEEPVKQGPAIIEESRLSAEAENIDVRRDTQSLQETRKGQEDKPVKFADVKPNEEALPKIISGVHKPIIPEKFPSKISQIPVNESSRPTTCEIPKEKQSSVDAEDKPVKPKWQERENKEAGEEEMKPPKYAEEEYVEPPPPTPKDVTTSQFEEFPGEDKDASGQSEELLAGISPLQVPGIPEMIEPSSEPKVLFQYQGEQLEDTTKEPIKQGPTIIKESTPSAEAEKIDVPRNRQSFPEMRKGQKDKPVKLAEEKPKESLPKTGSEVHRPVIPQEIPLPVNESSRHTTCIIPMEMQQLNADAKDTPVKPKWKEREDKAANEEEVQPPNYAQEKKYKEPPSSAPKDVTTGQSVELPGQEEDASGLSEELPADIPPVQGSTIPQMTETSNEPKVQFQYQVEKPEDTAKQPAITVHAPTAIEEPSVSAEDEKMDVPKEIKGLPQLLEDLNEFPRQDEGRYGLLEEPVPYKPPIEAADIPKLMEPSVTEYNLRQSPQHKAQVPHKAKDLKDPMSMSRETAERTVKLPAQTVETPTMDTEVPLLAESKRHIPVEIPCSPEITKEKLLDKKEETFHVPVRESETAPLHFPSHTPEQIKEEDYPVLPELNIKQPALVFDASVIKDSAKRPSDISEVQKGAEQESYDTTPKTGYKPHKPIVEVGKELSEASQEYNRKMALEQEVTSSNTLVNKHADEIDIPKIILEPSMPDKPEECCQNITKAQEEIVQASQMKEDPKPAPFQTPKQLQKQTIEIKDAPIKPEGEQKTVHSPEIVAEAPTTTIPREGKAKSLEVQEELAISKCSLRQSPQDGTQVPYSADDMKEPMQTSRETAVEKDKPPIQALETPTAMKESPLYAEIEKIHDSMEIPHLPELTEPELLDKGEEPSSTTLKKRYGKEESECEEMNMPEIEPPTVDNPEECLPNIRKVQEEIVEASPMKKEPKLTPLQTPKQQHRLPTEVEDKPVQQEEHKEILLPKIISEAPRTDIPKTYQAKIPKLQEEHSNSEHSSRTGPQDEAQITYIAEDMKKPMSTSRETAAETVKPVKTLETLTAVKEKLSYTEAEDVHVSVEMPCFPERKGELIDKGKETIEKMQQPIIEVNYKPMQLEQEKLTEWDINQPTVVSKSPVSNTAQEFPEKSIEAQKEDVQMEPIQISHQPPSETPKELQQSTIKVKVEPINEEEKEVETQKKITSPKIASKTSTSYGYTEFPPKSFDIPKKQFDTSPVQEIAKPVVPEGPIRLQPHRTEVEESISAARETHGKTPLEEETYLTDACEEQKKPKQKDIIPTKIVLEAPSDIPEECPPEFPQLHKAPTSQVLESVKPCPQETPLDTKQPIVAIQDTGPIEGIQREGKERAPLIDVVAPRDFFEEKNAREKSKQEEIYSPDIIKKVSRPNSPQASPPTRMDIIPPKISTEAPNSVKEKSASHPIYPESPNKLQLSTIQVTGEPVHPLPEEEKKIKSPEIVLGGPALVQEQAEHELPETPKDVQQGPKPSEEVQEVAPVQEEEIQMINPAQEEEEKEPPSPSSDASEDASSDPNPKPNPLLKLMAFVGFGLVSIFVLIKTVKKFRDDKSWIK